MTTMNMFRVNRLVQNMWSFHIIFSVPACFLNLYPYIWHIWDKVLKNGTSKICERQLLKNLTWPILEHFIPYMIYIHMRCPEKCSREKSPQDNSPPPPSPEKLPPVNCTPKNCFIRFLLHLSLSYSCSF